MTEGWECVESCPIRLLDEMSGARPTSFRTSRSSEHGTGGMFLPGSSPAPGYADKGGPSRFFQTFSGGDSDVSEDYLRPIAREEEAKQGDCSSKGTHKDASRRGELPKSEEDNLIEPVQEEETSVQILRGDCRDRLKELPDNSIDSVVTDPPYGLSKEPDIAEVMKHWLEGDDYLHNSKGFMGKTWDSFVPGPRYWKEVYRVMKPGAHLLCFSGTRTWDLMSMALRFAGFENRDTISNEGPPALRWYHGQGFPKGLDIGKAIDKLAGAEREVVGHKPIAYADSDCWGVPNSSSSNRGVGQGDVYGGIGPDFEQGYGKGTPVTAPATEEAKKWAGWNVALKPAWEVILVFRKPLSEKNLAQNVSKWNCGGLNIDASRVGADPEPLDWCECD